MKNQDLLERVLGAAMDNDLKNDILGLILKKPTRRTIATPLSGKPDSEAIYARMTAVAGGTGANVARLLGVSSQAINNQRLRGFISGNTIINFHLRTGVSLDWLVDGWGGNVDESGNGDRNHREDFPAKTTEIGGFSL